MAKSPLGSEFDKFLFAPIGEDRNGLQLSVVSLLARMNLDPWQEAGTLAGLSTEAAATRLASSLDTLTDPNLRLTNPRPLVLRLLALLPKRGAVPVAPVPAIDTAARHDPRSRLTAIIVIASVIFLFGTQLIHRSAPPQPGVVVAPAPLKTPVPAVPSSSAP
jgi:hypothetical protein